MEKTVCELFAGVGGFRLGLERSGKWKTVWFSQWEPSFSDQFAYNCYIRHFGVIDEFNNTDIAKVDKEHIPNHNLLVGGFPCQDYSVARSLSGEKGIQGVKGVLWWQIKEVLEVKKPPFVLLENVDRLLKSPSKQRGRDFGIMLSCFASLDYSVEWRVVNAADYGAAQKRRRVFIFAYKNTTKYGSKLKEVEIEKIFSKSGFFAKAFPIEEVSKEDIVEKTLTFGDLVDVSENFKFDFKNSGYMYDGCIYSVKTEPIKEEAIPLRKILQQDVPSEYEIKEENLSKWEFSKGAKKIERVDKETGYKYTFSEGACPFPDNIDVPARTMLTSEGTINRSSHAICDPQTNKIRTITPLEAERIQGFDDNWTEGMPDRKRYFCMGNALVVPMVTRMGKVLNLIFSKEKH